MFNTWYSSGSFNPIIAVFSIVCGLKVHSKKHTESMPQIFNGKNIYDDIYDDAVLSSEQGAWLKG